MIWSIAVLALSVLPRAASESLARAASTDSAAVAAAVAAFHAALRAGDSTAALVLLAPDATILEAGGAETVAQYRAGHLPSDIEFGEPRPASRARSPCACGEMSRGRRRPPESGASSAGGPSTRIRQS
jgi:hypothetical protein